MDNTGASPLAELLCYRYSALTIFTFFIMFFKNNSNFTIVDSRLVAIGSLRWRIEILSR